MRAAKQQSRRTQCFVCIISAIVYFESVSHPSLSMAKNAPIKTLLDLSKMRLEEATHALGKLISGEKASSEQLELLMAYRTEYHTRFMAAAKSGIDRNTWHNYQAFLNRLDASIAHAEMAVKQSRQRTARGQREWLDKKGNQLAFDTLVQRHQSREQYAALRVEQKDQDEFASQKFREKESL